MKSRQSGASLIIVLAMLAMLLLGSLALARVTETSTFVSGNIATKTAALQASEVGLSEAFAKLKTLTANDTDQGTWYFATRQDPDPGLGTSGVLTATTQTKVVGQYTVAYVIERLCTVKPVTDEDNQCFMKRIETSSSSKAGAELLESPAAIQYRLTVSVMGPKGTRSFVQAFATP